MDIAMTVPTGSRATHRAVAKPARIAAFTIGMLAVMAVAAVSMSRLWALASVAASMAGFAVLLCSLALVCFALFVWFDAAGGRLPLDYRPDDVSDQTLSALWSAVRTRHLLISFAIMLLLALGGASALLVDVPGMLSTVRASGASVADDLRWVLVVCIVYAAILFAGVVSLIDNARCPACGRIDMEFEKPDCPHCGSVLSPPPTG